MRICPSNQNLQTYEHLKSRLNDISMEKSKGAIIRSRAKWIEDGEKPTKYFFDLEKRNHIKKHVRKLRLPGSTETTNPEEILEYQKSFYESLYSSKLNIDDSEASNFFFNNDSIPVLTGHQQDTCEGDLTLSECNKALKTFDSNKRPGNDGLTIELNSTTHFGIIFLRHFWTVFKFSYEHGELSNSHRQAVITLLEKEGKDRNLIKKMETNITYKSGL